MLASEDNTFSKLEEDIYVIYKSIKKKKAQSNLDNNNNNNNNTYRAPYNKFSKRFTYINLKVHYIQI